jgi:S1-C subfamily serine protease
MPTSEPERDPLPSGSGDPLASGSGDPLASGPGEAREPDEDDLEDLRRRGRGRWVLALLLAIALAIPLTGVLLDELEFSRSADEIEQQLGAGDPLLDAVRLVRTVRCDGQVSTGSAFALEIDGETVLVTNRHVVDRAGSIGVRPITGNGSERVSSHRVSPDRDVAVLHLPEGADVPSPLDPAERVATGASIQIVGFPGGRPAASAGTVADQVGPQLVLDVQVQQGSSGSPVVNDEGHVIGQVSARTDDGQGLALRISDVIDAAGSTLPAPAC